MTSLSKSNLYKYLKSNYFKQPILEFGGGLYPDPDSNIILDFFEFDGSDDRYIKHNLNDGPYPLIKKFNTILCLRTIEYIDKPKVIIDEAFRLLDDKGFFIITVNNDSRKHIRWINKRGFPLKYNNITNAMLEDMLEKTGFSYIKWVNFPFNLNQRYLQPLWSYLFDEYVIFYVCRK